MKASPSVEQWLVLHKAVRANRIQKIPLLLVSEVVKGMVTVLTVFYVNAHSSFQKTGNSKSLRLLT